MMSSSFCLLDSARSAGVCGSKKRDRIDLRRNTFCIIYPEINAVKEWDFCFGN